MIIQCATDLKDWEQVEPLVEKAISYTLGEASVDDIRRAIPEKNMQLWTARTDRIVGVMVTERQVSNVDIMCIVLCAGIRPLADWAYEMLGIIEGWARELGCQYVMENGRMAWEKIGPPQGYRHVYSTMVKAL